MPRVTMLETYTCGDGAFRRGRTYEVTDARARMLVGRGSAQPLAESPTDTEAANAGPSLPDSGPESVPPEQASEDVPAPRATSKAKPAPKPKA